MNTDPTDTAYPHLDLGDLIAGATGQPVEGRAGEHLAGCEHCQIEARRWGVVAAGVRSLAGGTPEAALPAWPRSRRRDVAPRRRGLLAAGTAAAALVLLAGVGTVAGVVHVHLSGPGPGKVLTGVTGCSQLELAEGTLKLVDGDSLVVQAAGGRLVTVTTTASTFIGMAGPLLSDITDGATVRVRGTTSHGTVQAAVVTLGRPFSAVGPAGFVPLQGTVAGVTSSGFDLVTATGLEVPVTTSGSTLVVVAGATPGQLQAGAAIFALGQAGPEGTLVARAVASVSQISPERHINVSVKGCSPGALIEALGAISTAARSAG